MTQLEAVNLSLEAINEAPINTLEAPLPPDAAIAKRALEQAVEKVQAEGWYFNTERNFTLSRNADGLIPVPPGAFNVEVDFTKLPRTQADPVLRGGYLYDVKTQSGVFNVDVPVLRMVIQLPWDMLPPTAQRYAAFKATRAFVQRVMPGREVVGYSAQDELNERTLLLRESARSGRFNILDNQTSLALLRPRTV